MGSFLVVHVLHQRSEVRLLSDDGRRLRGVYEGCGEFACLVDAELLNRCALVDLDSIF